MHELPVTESILKIVQKHARMNQIQRVVTIRLKIGEMSDLEDEWIQRYFDYLSKDTEAAGAKLVIERSPIVLQCTACSKTYETDKASLKEPSCPACGSKSATLVAGREYYIQDLEGY
jgi:hydrogenase nickel incorporation protein HypA/HybF